MTLKELIKPHEGYRRFPYLDTKGILTIGYGRNLRDVGVYPEELEYLGRTLDDIKKNGISEAEAGYLLGNDIQRAIHQAGTFPFWDGLDNVRKAVVAEMVLNLGKKKFDGFRNTIAAIEIADYEEAADEMLDSEWARQVGKKPGQRAFVLSEMMRTGHAPGTKEA